MTRARVLTFTSLYLSVAKPRHGIFVETCLRQLMLDAAGVRAVLEERSPPKLAPALRECIATTDRVTCRAHAARSGWRPVARELQQLFERVLASSKQPQVEAA